MTKSAEEKRQEQLQAYLDDALTPHERQQFEQELERDPVLQAQLDNSRELQQQMRRLPRRPVPRNFTLDPAVYGRPARQPLFQFYPVLQGATVLTALFFILALSLTLFQPSRSATQSTAAVPEVAMSEEQTGAAPEADTFAVEESADESAAASSAANEVVVTEEVTAVEAETAEDDTAEAETMAEEPMAEAAPAEEEEMVEVETTEEEAAGEAATSGAADESAPQATAVPPAPLTADEAAATATTAPTTTPAPTATPSELPRPATQTAENRSLDVQATETAADDDAAANTTADSPDEQQSPPTSTPEPADVGTANPLRLAQVGLGILLIIFGGLTFYVRRNS
ncbi:MAG: hypothetical protein H6658_07340 [Ardenticatenaceae bacterium]|nr:hypothetical protein [Ardenticatenaceae bacterium]